MQVVGKVAGVILTIIVVPMFVLAACNAAIDSTIRAPETYADTLENDAIFVDLVPVAIPAIVQAANNENIEHVGEFSDSPVLLSDVIEALDADEWREVTNLLISPTWLQARTEQLVVSFLAIANGSLDVINEPFDLADLRQRLLGDEAQEAAVLILASAPECTRTQTDRIRTFLATEEGELPICNPSEPELYEGSLTTLVAWLNSLAEQLGSDTPTVGEFLNMQRDNARAINIFFELNRQGMLLVFLCPMAFLALIVTVAIRSYKGFGRWTGLTFVLSGVGVLIMIVMAQVMAFGLVSEALKTRNDLDVFLGRIASEMVRSAFAQANGTMFVYMGIYIAIGFVLLAISFFVNRDDDDGEMVLIGEDGSIISTASQKRIGQIENESL